MVEHMTVGDVLQQIDQRPSDSDLYQQRGGLYLKDGKLDEARQAYERAIELDPKDPFAHLFLGNTLEAQKLFHRRWQATKLPRSFCQGRQSPTGVREMRMSSWSDLTWLNRRTRRR